MSTEEIDFSIPVEQLEDLCKDLNIPETIEQIFDRIKEEGGIKGAAVYYGASFTSYSHHLLAGRLGYTHLLAMIDRSTQEQSIHGGSSISLYLTQVVNILRPEIISYIRDNMDHFQSRVATAEKRFSKNFDWLMFMSHKTSYLLRDDFGGKVIESPALLHLRVVAELFYQRQGDQEDNLAEALHCYELSTEQFFTFASPVLFNAGHSKPNLCSCFLMRAEDSLPGIMGTMYKAALVSKATGGVGMDISSIRHSRIGHSGMSRGVIPMLQVYDKLIRYVDQTGKRNGASTVFIQAHHIDLLAVIRSTLKHANADTRLDSLNTAIMFPDIFWERLKEDGPWTLFCPAMFPGLNESFGEKYRELYLKYESMPLNKKDEEFRVRVTARMVVDTLADSQIMSGMPYVLHKDSINYCSNQVNLNSPNPLHHRTIRASNLCLEIMEQVDSEEVACCNLGQMSLKAFVRASTSTTEAFFDFQKFGYVVRSMVKFLDRVIDRNHYVFTEAETSNMRHRPIGLGVSGYADMLDILQLPYESDEASLLNRRVFACMYYNAMVSSMELAIKTCPYSTFMGSPLSEGKFSFDLWKVRKAQLEPDVLEPKPIDPREWGQEDISVEGLTQVLPPSWEALRTMVMRYGVRNSQMLAVMPSASTSRLMGNAENTEAHQSNLYIRNFMKASAVVINPQLFAEIDGKLKLWSRDVAEFIISQEGSVARLPDFLLATAETPEEKAKIASLGSELAQICLRYKTMFEIKQLKAVKQTSDRHRYVCQGISFNVYLSKPTRAMLRALHLATHKSGNKTGLYYLRESQISETPSYARTSSKVKGFLTGPILPLISSHEPFPAQYHTKALSPVVIRQTAPVRHVTDVAPIRIAEKEDDGFLALPDVEIISQATLDARARSTEEEGPSCKREAGCVSCGS